MKKQKAAASQKRKIKDIPVKKDVKGGDKKKNQDKQDYLVVTMSSPLISG